MLPKGVLDRLGLKPGDHLDVTVEDKVIILTPRTVTLDELCSTLPPPKRPITVEEMKRAIQEGA